MATGLIAPDIGAPKEEIVEAIKRLVLRTADALSGPLLLHAGGDINAPDLAWQGNVKLGMYRVSIDAAALVSDGVLVAEWKKDASGIAFGVGVAPTVAFHVSKTHTGDWLAILNQAGAASGDKGLSIRTGDTHAATAVLQATASGANVFSVFADGGVVAGTSASPGAASIQADSAIGVGLAPTVPLHVSKLKTGGFAAIIKQLGGSSGDKGLQVSTVDTHAATAVLETTYNTSTIGFRVWADGGVVVGSAASPGADTLQVTAALGVGLAPQVPFHVSVNKSGDTVAKIEQVNSSSGARGLRVLSANTTAANDAFAVYLNNVLKFGVWGDGGVAISGTGNSPGDNSLLVDKYLYIKALTGLFFSANVHASITSGAAAVQAHATIANPSGFLFAVDSAGYVALYSVEGSVTVLMSGGFGGAARWGSGSASSGASHTSLYVSGGTLLIKNDTGGTLAYYLYFLAK